MHNDENASRREGIVQKAKFTHKGLEAKPSEFGPTDGIESKKLVEFLLTLRGH